MCQHIYKGFCEKLIIQLCLPICMKRILPLIMLIILALPVFAQQEQMTITSPDGLVIRFYDLEAPGARTLARDLLRDESFTIGEHPEIGELEQSGAIRVSGTSEAVKRLLGEHDAGSFLTFILFGLLAAVPLVIVYHEISLRPHRKKR